jgi:hypothetical protein
MKNDSGFRSLVSAGMKVVRLGLEKGWLIPSDGVGKDLGFPELVRTSNDSRWPRAQFVWDRLVRFAVAKQTSIDQINNEFLMDFYRRVIEERGDLGRRDLRWFLEIMEVERTAGRFINLSFPALPSKRKKNYALPLEEWPENYQEGIDRIMKWLMNDLVEDRGQRPRLRNASAQREIQSLEQIGGYVVNVLKLDMRRLNWKTLFSYDQVFDYLLFTDPGAEKHSRKGKILTGVYQQGLLDSYIRLMDGPLKLPEVCTSLKNLRFRFLFREKREGPPQDLTPNSFFQTAKRLISIAADLEKEGRLVDASIHRRDALILALFGLFPRRTSTFHRINLGSHVILRDGELPRLTIPREETKTAQRDSVLEIPLELLPLFWVYLLEDRTRLLGGNEDPKGPLFISQGGSPFCPDNARSIVRRRMKEVLGFNIGPHSARKVWTPRFLLYSNGDYLSAMAILDTNLAHVEKAYRDAQEQNRAERYFEETTRTWEKVKAKRMNGNGR